MGFHLVIALMLQLVERLPPLAVSIIGCTSSFIRPVYKMSHPPVRVNKKFLSPSPWELNISPNTTLGRNLFAPPDRHLYAR